MGYRVTAIAVFLDLSDIHNQANDYVVDDRGNVRSVSPPSNWAVTKRFLKGNSMILRLLDAIKDWFQYRAFLEQAEEGERFRIDTTLAGWTIDENKLQSYGHRGLETARKHMDQLAELTESRGIPLTVVVYPWPDQIWYRDLDSIQARFWREWAAGRSVDFLNLFPLFIDALDPKAVIERYFIPYDTHWNRAGHRRVADAFLDAWTR